MFFSSMETTTRDQDILIWMPVKHRKLVVESPCDYEVITDGAALSAYQYFENVRNFLVGIQDLGILSFEASDLEQGGKPSRVVNCVLGLKAYDEWKQMGGTGIWKFGGNIKPNASVKQIVRKNSEPFTRSMYEKPINGACIDAEINEMLVESVLNKVVEEFEHRVASKAELVGQRDVTLVRKEDSFPDEELERRCVKQYIIVEQQGQDIKNLKQTLLTTKAGMQFMRRKFHEEMHNIGIHINSLAHAASGYHRVFEENRWL